PFGRPRSMSELDPRPGAVHPLLLFGGLPMSGDAFAKNTLAPLVLRLALAAVFIYHGVDKVSTGSDWGATWATDVWRHKADLPRDVKEKLGGLAEKKGITPEEKANIHDVRQQLVNLYRREVNVPPAALEQHWAQLAVAWGELLGGILLLIGFGSRLAAAWLIVIQVGAIYTVTGMRGFSLAEGGGYEDHGVLGGALLAGVLPG